MNGVLFRSIFHSCVDSSHSKTTSHPLLMEKESLQNREGRCDESVSFSSTSNELSGTIPSMLSCNITIWFSLLAASSSEKQDNSDTFFSFIESVNISRRRSIVNRFRQLCDEDRYKRRQTTKSFIPQSKWVLSQTQSATVFEAHVIYHPLVMGDIVCDPVSSTKRKNLDISIPLVGSFDRIRQPSPSYLSVVFHNDNAI